MMCLDESDGMLFKGRKGLAPGDVTGDAAVFEAGSLFNYVATSSGESCRSSSDSASSAPCSPESVLSDSGGVEGLPDSVAGLVSGDLVDLDDDAVVAATDPGFNLSRLLLPQQHRQGESAAEARKRDLRLVDEVVAAATASTVAPPVDQLTDPVEPSPPASPCPKLSASAASHPSSSASATTSATTCSSTSTAVLVVSSAVSSVLSVPSPTACSGTASSSQAALCVTVPSACRQVAPLVSSPKCAPLVAPTASAPHSGGCVKSRRPRRLSDGAKKRDNTATSGSQRAGPEDDEAEDEDICRRREAEVESLLRHCINLVADRLDPQHIAQRNHHRDHQQAQEEARSHHESRQRDHHQQAASSSSPPRSHRHQEHQPHCNTHQRKESRHQERHHRDSDSDEPSSSEQHRNQLATLEQEGHHPELDSHPSLQQQHHHLKKPHLRQQQQQATTTCPPSSPEDSIPEDCATMCLLAATPSASTSSTVDRTIASVPGTSSSSFLAAAPSPSAPSVADDGLLACRWLDCEMRLRGEEALGDHVRVAHVDTQTRDQGVYLCRWQGCKVFERRSCSRQWLERHVTLSHCGSKPFACIVAGCGQRFGSQGALQRHVNAHFERSLNGSGPVPFGAGAGSGSSGSGVASGGSLLGSRGFSSKELANGDSPLKLLRLRKKLKCRRRAWATAKHADFFDAGVMEELRHRLADVSAPQTPTEPHSWNGSTVTFHATVVARRKENTGKVKVLLHWTPEHILPDSWVTEDQPTEKVVALSSLSADDFHTLNLWPKDLPSLSRDSGRRRKRK